MNESRLDRSSFSRPCPRKSGRGFSWRVAARAVAILACAGLGLRAEAAPVPQDGPPEVWAKIGPQVERQLYAFDAEGRALNREQDFQLAAESAGLAVNAALRLRATALNGAPLPEAAPVVRENRVEYPRGAVTEWFENRQDGVEQGFTVKDEDGRMPDEVRLTLAFGDDMTVEVAEGGQEAIMTQGSARYRYAGLKAWDATGREWPSVMSPVSPSGPSAFSLHPFSNSSAMRATRSSPSPSIPS